MSMKKPAAILAGVGTCALAVASCSVSSSQTPASDRGSQSDADSSQSASVATASSSPVIDPDRALTPKGTQSGETEPSMPEASTGADDPARLVIIIVHLEEGADREATLASINEAVAGVYPDATVEVEREYKNALHGYALRAPAGSLDAIRAVSGVKLAAIEGEMRVQ